MDRAPGCPEIVAYSDIIVSKMTLRRKIATISNILRSSRITKTQCLVWIVVCAITYICYHTYIRTQHPIVSPRRHASVSRRRDDGAWYNYSAPPALLFFAYSAFVDVRTPPAAANGAPAVVRVIAISTKSEVQLQRHITLFCVFNYHGGRTTTVSTMLPNPSPIGTGYPLYGIFVREYVYACPILWPITWPITLSISTDPRRQHATESGPMPVEVSVHRDVMRPLAVCVQVTFERRDPVRLVEWFELLRLLGVSLVGVYITPDISESAHTVLRHYSEVDGLVDLWRSDYIGPVVGGSATSPRQYLMHGSPVINDCVYRNMYQFKYIAVFDFDEVHVLNSPLLSTALLII